MFDSGSFFHVSPQAGYYMSGLRQSLQVWTHVISESVCFPIWFVSIRVPVIPPFCCLAFPPSVCSDGEGMMECRRGKSRVSWKLVRLYQNRLWQYVSWRANRTKFPIRANQAAESLPGRNNQQTGGPSWKAARGCQLGSTFLNLLIFFPPFKVADFGSSSEI